MVIVAQIACSTSEKAITASSCTASPPANINVTLCSNITGGADATKVSQCTTCCTGGGYALSSFAYNDHCTCGSLNQDASTAPCAAQITDAEDCFSCCSGAGYQNYQYVSDASCGCTLKGNSTICAEAPSQPNPADACACCCLGKGFISSAYIGFGTPQCECLAE